MAKTFHLGVNAGKFSKLLAELPNQIAILARCFLRAVGRL
jgi:hypothetical protein